MEVEASSDGRRLTLDPIRTIDISVSVREVESTVPCGFRQEWISGTSNDGHEFELYAGVASPWLIIHVDGKQYCTDIRDLLSTFLDRVLA